MKVSVILPTYNEKGNICELVEAVRRELKTIAATPEIIVVDDNSPDGTGEHVTGEYAGNSEVKVFVRTRERGLATAIRYGIERAEGEIIVVMDTDFSHSPDLLPQMVKFLEYYDLIIGSRYTQGGGMYDEFRYFGSFVFNMMVRIVLNTRIQDNLSGFFAMRRRMLMDLDFDKIFWGYGDYFFRLLFYARANQVRMLSIPVVYRERESGDSKTNLSRCLLRYTMALLKLRFSSVRVAHNKEL